MVEIVEIESLRDLSRSLAGAESSRDFFASFDDMLSNLVHFDACFVFLFEKDQCVLAGARDHAALETSGQSKRVAIEAPLWLTANPRVVAAAKNAAEDPCFRVFAPAIRGKYEAFLSVPIAGREGFAGVVNLMNHKPHTYTEREIGIVEALSFFAGAKIEMLRLEKGKAELGEELQSRKLVERAKGILQKDLQIAEGEAYCLLRRESRQRRKPMKEIARAVVLAKDLRRLSAIRRPHRASLGQLATP